MSDIEKDQLKVAISIATRTLAIAWLIWVSKTLLDLQAFAARGDRFSLEMGHMLEQRIDARIDSLPPKDWRDRINSIERNVIDVRNDLTKTERAWTRDYLRKDEHKH